MKLSKECIEAIEKISQISLNPKSYASGATEALTNPSIYEKAGLISLEDAFGFAEFTSMNNWVLAKDSKMWYHPSGKRVTTAQLFQIYQQQKEK